MFSVVKELYKNVCLLAFEIDDDIVMFCFSVFGKPYISLSIPTIKY